MGIRSTLLSKRIKTQSKRVAWCCYAVPLIIFGFVVVSEQYRYDKAALERTFAEEASNFNSLLAGWAEQSLSISTTLQTVMAKASDAEVAENILAALVASQPSLENVYIQSNGSLDFLSPNGERLEAAKIWKQRSFKRIQKYLFSPLFYDDSKIYSYVAMPVKGVGVFVGKFHLPEAKYNLAATANGLHLISALVPEGKLGDQISMRRNGDLYYWQKIAAFSSIRDAGDVTVNEKTNFVRSYSLPYFSGRALIGIDADSVFNRTIVLLSRLILIFVLGSLVILIAMDRLLAPVVKGAERLKLAFSKLSNDNFDYRMPLEAGDEVNDLSGSFNEAIDCLSQRRRLDAVETMAVKQLFEADDNASLIIRSLEIIVGMACANESWFVFNRSDSSDNASQVVNDECLGWHATNHRVEPFYGDQWQSPSVASDGKQYEFCIRDGQNTLGNLFVYYKESPSEATDALLNVVMGVLDLVVQRRKNVSDLALRAREAGVAKSLAHTLNVSEEIKGQKYFAYEFGSHAQLGSDWVYVTQSGNENSIHINMGSVTGSGIIQGFVSARIRGLLASICAVIKTSDSSFLRQPQEVVSLIHNSCVNKGDDGIVVHGISAKINLDSNVLSYSNDNYCSPIHIAYGDETVVNILDNQDNTDECSVEIQPGDHIVFRTDSFLDEVQLKSEVFDRILIRKLGGLEAGLSALEIKDQLVSLFQFYTQGKRLATDSCIIVFEVCASTGSNKEKTA